MATDQLMTAEELIQLGREFDPCELIDGRLVRRPFGTIERGRITADVGSMIHQFADEHDLGETLAPCGFITSRNPDTVIVPRCAFIQSSRVVKTGRDFYFEGAPDLAVEIVSPPERADEIADHLDRWLKAGARSVWVIDCDLRTIAIHRPYQQPKYYREGQTLTDDTVLPGFSLNVTEVFDD